MLSPSVKIKLKTVEVGEKLAMEGLPNGRVNQKFLKGVQ